MLILECTKKLVDELKVSLDVLSFHGDPLYEWHANKFIYRRRKCCILMNNKTRYCIILYGLKKEHFLDFGRTVVLAIENNFLAEGLKPKVVSGYLENIQKVIYTKTYDRSILGQMNDMVFLATNAYFKDEDFYQLELNKKLNQVPLPKSKYLYGIRGLRDQLEN
ncbi:hypothetical protein REC12_23155 [Desulfosporosinus sp. PR]|uniref:DUF6933 domain-containing protein n=1 Tax=Candidatus Desulfosporosinus nitrosoreducens TaxID=3401928 RepID=UPI0027F8DFAE|nr:hypothetical protein [Desulfosporosinus sp. PR]MDQ7096498.1 hypothetical protein [Desulfosporosinus sp. PR]